MRIDDVYSLDRVILEYLSKNRNTLLGADVLCLSMRGKKC